MQAYNLLARDQVMYKHPGIPHRFKAPCFLTCALVGSSGVLRWVYPLARGGCTDAVSDSLRMQAIGMGEDD